MRALGLRRVTIIVVALMVSGCAVLRPQTDPMDLSPLPPASSMSKSTFAPLNSDLPFAKNFDAALRQAQELRKRGELDAASRVLAQLVLASPDDPRVVGEYGKVMLESGRTDDAVVFLDRAVTLQPSDWTLFSALGVAFDQKDNRQEARAAFNRALTIKPGEPTVLSNLALSYMQAGELDEAERLLLLAAAQGRDVPGVAAKLAMVRNIRTTTAQSRPLTVSAIPQPVVSAVDSESQVQPPPIDAVESAVPILTPALVETAPARSIEPPPPPSQEPVEEEEPATPEDVETENVALLLPAPIVAAAPPPPAQSSRIKVLTDDIKVQTERPAPASAAPKPVQAQPKAATARQEPTLALKSTATPTPPRVSISAKAISAGPQTVTAKPPVTAPPAAIVAAAPRASAPAANPSPQSAFMTRRAGVTSAVTRTAPVPLVLAPPRDSWESMVRVSLPQASPAAREPAVHPDQGIVTQPQPEPSGWSEILKRWSSAMLGFISNLWA